MRLLLYCANPKRIIPVHNLLADVVEVCAGSRQLLKVLNTLGCVSSPDTHDRFVTKHAEVTRQKSICLRTCLPLPLSTTLICFKAIQLSIVVGSSVATMALQYKLYNLEQV